MDKHTKKIMTVKMLWLNANSFISYHKTTLSYRNIMQVEIHMMMVECKQ